MDFFVYISNKHAQLQNNLYLEGEWEVTPIDEYAPSARKFFMVIADFVDTLLDGDRIVKFFKESDLADFAA